MIQQIKHLSLILFLLFITNFSFSQEKVFEEKIKLEYVHKDKRESYSIVDSKKSEFGLFLLDYKSVNAYFFNKNLELFFKKQITKPKGKYAQVLGSTIHNGIYNLFLTTRKNNKFFFISINPLSGETIQEELKVKLKGERYLQSFTYENQLYILTVKTLSSTLALYIIKDQLNFEIKEFDFSNESFNKNDDNLSLLLTQPSGQANFIANVVKINTTFPNSIEVASIPNKLYHYNDKMILSIDNHNAKTTLITINLNNYSSSVKFYKKAKIDFTRASKIQSNSFLFNNVLFQIKGCENELYISMRNLKKDSILNEYRIKKNQTFSLNSNPVHQEVGDMIIHTPDLEKAFVNTGTLLSKLSEKGLGISAFEMNDNVILTIGSGLPTKKTNVQWNSNTHFTHGPPVKNISTYTYNTRYNSYQAIKNNRSVYFKSLFDKKSFTVVKDSIDSTVYDEINNFTNNLNKKIIAETLLKCGGIHYLGYYLLKEKKYIMRKF